jgi:hypothetical protein
MCTLFNVRLSVWRSFKGENLLLTGLEVNEDVKNKPTNGNTRSCIILGAYFRY